MGGEQARVTFVVGPGEREKQDEVTAENAQEGEIQLRKIITNTLVARSIVCPRRRTGKSWDRGTT